MPELPEVEIIRRGLEIALRGRRIETAVVRNRTLRWGVARALPRQIADCQILRVSRRAKYLLLECDRGTLIVHLGMSGSVRILAGPRAPDKHEHVDLVLDNGSLLRLKDPRRFGAVLWHKGAAHLHRLLANLGPEPLSAEFSGALLYQKTRTRQAAIKQVLMDAGVVAGLGNIYVNEALFRANINPKKAARRIGLARYEKLAQAVRETLAAALLAGGSTLRDFTDSEGRAGCFQNDYVVYGRTNEACKKCGAAIKRIVQGARSTFYCPRCQRS